MKKIFINSIITAISALCFWSCSQESYDWSKGKNIISVTNYKVNHIDITSFSLSFTCQQNVDTKINEIYLEYGNNYYDYDYKINIDNFNPNGENTVEISDYTSNTEYKFRIRIKLPDSDYITIMEGTMNSPVVDSYIPTPTTLEITKKSISSVNAKFTLTNTDYTDLIPIEEAGFFYEDHVNITPESGKKVIGKLENGVVSADITGLSPRDNYYVGGYVKTKYGTKVTNMYKINLSTMQ